MQPENSPPDAGGTLREIPSVPADIVQMVEARVGQLA